ncbi:MAG: nuclear transport factor 2 family protein, partial [Thermoanaerobaculia bacterium]
TRSNPQRVQSLYDSFARGDIPALLGSFDPNIVWMEAESISYADRNPYRGSQAVLEGVFMRIGQDWNGFAVNVEQIIDGGDTVVALGRYTATNKSTGKPLDSQFVHVWWFRGDKVVRFQQYADTAQFARVSGEWK